MSQDNRTWIGVDPGGEGSFGVAILHSDGSTYTCCVDCADEAIEVICQRVKSAPAGIGVDAPLWWSSGRSSDRCADQWIRSTYGLPGGKVQTANSLVGAVLVQGVMFVQQIRKRFPGAPVTETHPKALLAASRVTNDEAFRHCLSAQSITVQEPEHERDAMISAVAAREGFGKRWLRDLSLDRHESEQDPSKYWLAPINYFWPK